MTTKEYLLRLSTLFTQEKLASQLGVSFVSVNRWINEKSLPHHAQQAKIEALYQDHFGKEEINPKELAKKKSAFLQTKDPNFLGDFLKNEDLIHTFLVRLTYNTNAIEGSTVTEADTESIMDNGVVLPKYSIREHLEVANHKKAFFTALELVKSTKPLTEDDILWLHKILMSGILENAEVFRFHPVRILGSGVPTANYLKIPSLMEDFLEMVNTPTKDMVHLLASSHAFFERVHPFSDGNGRIGRLLLLILSLKNSFPLILIPKEKKQAYYKALQMAQIHEKYEFLEEMICENFFVGAPL